MDFRALLSAAAFPVLMSSGALVYNSCATKSEFTEAKPKADHAAVAKPHAPSPGAPGKPDETTAVQPSLKTAAKPLTAAKPRVLPPPPKLAASSRLVAKAPPAKSAAKAELKVVKLEEKKTAAVVEKSEKGEMVTRYVTVGVLNVRSKPSITDSTIVGRLVKGSALPVEIKGEWARVGDQQWVQTKYLSPNQLGRAMASK